MTDSSDYASQTVATLRTMLKNRGIPSTGLTRKAQIVEKLEEQDRAIEEVKERERVGSEVVEGVEGVDGEKKDEEGREREEGEGQGKEDNEENEEQEKSEDSPAPATDAQPQAEAVREESAAAEPPVDEETVSKVSGATEAEASAPLPAPEHHETIQPVEESPASKTATPAPAPAEAAPAEEPPQPPATANTSVSQTPVPTNEDQAPALAQTEESGSAAPEPSAEPSRVTSVELKEDSRKRKRRSVTPPVDEEAARKKLRQQEEDANEAVHVEKVGDGVPVDLVVNGKETGSENGTKTDDVVMAEADADVEAKPDETVLPASTSDDVVAEIEGPAEVAEELAEENRDDPGLGERGQQVLAERAEEHDRADQSFTSPRRPSVNQKDGRYKDLFQPSAGTAMPSEAPPADTMDLLDDHDVSPALHPATRALYIRDLMRPIQPRLLQTHLITLATPPSSPTPDDSLLETFFLDPIKSHVFALFSTTAAASRVRFALHATVWPPERTRKPLWADFVPEEKVADWIAMEEEAINAGGPRGQGKRWEVVYTPSDDGVVAHLQEVGTASSHHHPATAPVTGIAASAPAPSDANRAPAAAPKGPAAEKSFVALDALFKSTTAKPKLYFLPVGQDLAERRLRELERSSGRAWDGSRLSSWRGEERRYGFEDGDVLVDLGADRGGFGPGGGPGGGRGGFGGGDGFRGGFRGRGDRAFGRGGGSWRGR
ncbi:hypothetical protein K490DRAFT_69099 [Saccharata proteae CBS 121410]|uniref:SAP domain-containing protein n=1 Tax=Saccharata proteae CBS 121410 TaxID=1314787 RepID=A0A9P4LVF9_9PEZI|nr:hypothetical protein K490DRAFT_69099 [Saccharata proteae CBS 121410]